MDIIRKKVIIVFILLGASFSLFSQNNPLKLNSLYTADPTARNWGDGKIWLYPSHDVPCMGCYSSMNDYHVFSSSNGVKWRDYGSILSIDKLNQLGWNVHNAWAPDCVYQKGLFYFYFPVQGIVDKKWKIGVVSSKRPMGPFESPSLVVEDWGIDPSVLVDDDGRAY
ncbi:MAG: family 43 glycosylhydrolase, partial [Bacteroidaceae bacterium]